MDFLLYIKYWIQVAWQFVTNPQVGALASLTGTLISIYVGFTVRDIRRKAMLKTRVPTLARKISEKASQLNDLLNNYEANKELIHDEIELAQELLRNACSKISGETKSTIKAAITQIKKSPRTNGYIPRESARLIYTKLLVSVQAINNLIEDTNQEI